MKLVTRTLSKHNHKLCYLTEADDGGYEVYLEINAALAHTYRLTETRLTYKDFLKKRAYEVC